MQQGGKQALAPAYEAEPTYNTATIYNLWDPPANRAYTKNEIVCAMVSLFVPANVRLVDDAADEEFSLLQFNWLILSGTDISLDLLLNGLYGANAADYHADLPHDFPVYPPLGQHVLPTEKQWHTKGESSIELNLGLGDNSSLLLPSEKDETYHVLYFARITGDNPSLTARLTRNVTDHNVKTAGEQAGRAGTRIGYDYAVKRAFPTMNNGVIDLDSPQIYIISEIESENAKHVIATAQLFRIHTTSGRQDAAADGVEVTPQYQPEATEWFRVTYHDGKYEYALSRTAKQASRIGRAPSTYERAILDYRMQEIFANALKLDITGHGWRLNLQDWADYINSMHDIVATVGLQPYVSYVSVPDNIVTR